jgi:hypothetical protein
MEMPALGLLILGAQVLCVIHVIRTGRPYWWIFLIVMVPAVGILVYLIVEVFPGLLGSRGARQAVSGAAKVFNPGRRLREAQRQLEISPSAQNKATLANELLLAGQPEASAALYREALTGIHATDPALMLGLARALFALGDAHETQLTLERLREANPGYASPDGHLLYARSLEQQGKTDAALDEYAALVAYYPGQEARARYALLLEKAGRIEEAQKIFEEIRQSIDYGPRHQYREQREWYELAKKHLAT